MGDAFRPPLRLFRLLVVIVAFVIFLADVTEVTAFLQVLIVLTIAFRKQYLGVHELVEISSLLNFRNAALDVLLFKIEYLFLCNLAPKIKCFILWTEQGVILRVAETVDFNVN